MDLQTSSFAQAIIAPFVLPRLFTDWVCRCMTTIIPRKRDVFASISDSEINNAILLCLSLIP